MLSFFPDPYVDELLYSTIARYHYYCGNIDFKDTLIEIFGSDSVIPTVEFPSRLDYLARQFSNNKMYSSDYLIQNHTLYPFYSPFLPLSRQTLIENEMKYGDGKGIHAQVGISAGGICKKNGLYYCPECVLKDKQKYGEPYFYRIHQLQGINVCSIHHCMLNSYPIFRNTRSRIAFIMLEYENTDTDIKYITDDKSFVYHNIISDSAQYLLNNDLGSFNQQSVYEKYRILLKNKGLMTYNGTVKHKELFNEFIKFYGADFLSEVDSFVEYDDLYNWLRLITQKPRRVIHPVRHILFINFLANSIKEFFEGKCILDRPFGTGPWPCMNPVSEHFRKCVVSECSVTADFKTRQPVGTFACSCGFVYSRKGPDRLSDDQYKVGRIKQYGHIWEYKLKELLLENKYSTREIGNRMDCDSKTVLRHSCKLGMDGLLKSNTKLAEAKVVNSTQSGDQYKADILKFIENNPGKNRKEIRNNLKKQYAWLYRNDRKWIDINFPEEIPREIRNKGHENRVDWSERDTEILKVIQEEYKKLIAREKPIRITKSVLGKRTGMSAALDININKLPFTKAYLESVTESVEEFQIRRIRWVCCKLYKSEGSLKKWEVIRKAGLRPGYSKKVDEAINEIIINLCEGKNEGQKG